MNTSNKRKSFDCVKMKNDIQSKIYAETKDMSTTELLDYFNGRDNSAKQQQTCWQSKSLSPTVRRTAIV